MLYITFYFCPGLREFASELFRNTQTFSWS